MKTAVALVTGGTSGLGFEVAQEYARRGISLILQYRSRHERAEAARAQLLAQHPQLRVDLVAADFADLAAVEAFLPQLDALVGERQLKYFVSSHGELGSNLFLFKKRSELQSLINQHLLANVFLTHHIVKAMARERFGRIVFITSLAAHKINRGQADYALSKAALETFAQSLTAEFYHRSVTANCVCAGLANTRIADEVHRAFEKEESEVGRVVDRTTIARIVGVLSEDWAQDISGASWLVDGGQKSLGNNRDYHRLSFHAKKDS